MSATATYQTRPLLSQEATHLLDRMGDHLSRVERHLFCDLQRGRSVNDLKRSYIHQFRITARHFNSCRINAEGKIRSRKELTKQRLEDLNHHITKIERQFDRDHSRRLKLKLDQLRSKRERLSKELESGCFSFCFGSRKLFQAQFHLEKSGFKDHAEWQARWRGKRSNSFFLMGSKDETGGNQSCTAIIAEEGSIVLRLRLPFEEKYLLLEGIRFAHGHEEICRAIRECTLRKELQAQGDLSYKERGQAISYRFLRDDKGYRIYITVDRSEPVWVSDPRLGRVGVDINGDHLAIAETDRFGNPVETFSIPLCLYGKESNQSRAMIGDACKQLVFFALSRSKPIVVEKLDFQNKRRDLRESMRRTRRQLSSFAYHKILERILSRSYREGIKVEEVNPAYTSLIGRIKFAKRYGITIHHAAALTIARRAQGYSEYLPSHADVPDGKGGHMAFVLPEWNGQRSHWSYLGRVQRALRAASAKHFRMAKRQSTGPPV